MNPAQQSHKWKDGPKNSSFGRVCRNCGYSEDFAAALPCAGRLLSGKPALWTGVGANIVLVFGRMFTELSVGLVLVVAILIVFALMRGIIVASKIGKAGHAPTNIGFAIAGIIFAILAILQLVIVDIFPHIRQVINTSQ